MHEHNVGVSMQKPSMILFFCNSVTACNSAKKCGVTKISTISSGNFVKCNTVTPFPLSKYVREKNKNGNEYYFSKNPDVIKAQALRCYTFASHIQIFLLRQLFLLRRRVTAHIHAVLHQRFHVLEAR